MTLSGCLLQIATTYGGQCFLSKSHAIPTSTDGLTSKVYLYFMCHLQCTGWFSMPTLEIVNLHAGCPDRRIHQQEDCMLLDNARLVDKYTT